MNPYTPPNETDDESVAVTHLLDDRAPAKPLRSFAIAVCGALLGAGPWIGTAPVQTLICVTLFGLAVVWLERLFRGG